MQCNQGIIIAYAFQIPKQKTEKAETISIVCVWIQPLVI